MKILQLCAVDFTLYHFLVPLVRGMTAAGHEVVAVCADGPLAAQVRAQGIRVETVPFSRDMFAFRRHLRAYRELSGLLRRERFDLVHVHTPVAAMIGRLAAWRAGVRRIVYTAHGFYFHERMPAPKRWIHIALEWLPGRVTDVLFTQAEEDAATARRLGLCAAGVVAAIGNGVSPERFHPASTPAARLATRRALDTPKEACVIVVIGRLVVEKGYRELFAAMASVDAVLWVVGERLVSDHAQDIGPAIEAVRADPTLSRRIRFLGQRTDVPEILRAADIFTLPSHREGMPRSIIEAMMTGLAVVATDIRGSREEVLDEDTGLLVPVMAPAALARALNRLIEAPELRRAMGAAGLARARALYDESNVIARQITLLGL
ncbi:MAG: glycosyltransferase family 4 protein [Alphaproteobacteria bacterium]|jgi:glycosyltransferase involved in cell wall biosynthesis|nr:glycosyltransferase family 4 protein [Alphaproteobacteria bacterium]MDP6518088.1 glycosyltransferase family 4 protein [Alphaproteobacteria bacterium]